VVHGAKRTLARLAPLLFLELHNEMIRSEGSDPSHVLDDLEEMRYEMFSIDGVKIDRSATLQMPICHLVGRCRQSSWANTCQLSVLGEISERAVDGRKSTYN
jgi:hypothetical protein